MSSASISNTKIKKLKYEIVYENNFLLLFSDLYKYNDVYSFFPIAQLDLYKIINNNNIII